LLPHLSSIGSTAVVPTWYPVDNITGETPCCLHISIDRVENKTKEDVIGVATSGCVFHNNPIPTEYVKVLVREIIDMAYIDYPLDHVTLEGIIKELGEAVNQFVLWNQREIVLDGPTMPQNQLMLPLSQTATPKGNEAPLPTSSPPVPKFKEALLPSSPNEKEVSTLPSSPVKVMPQQDLGLYNPSTRSNPTNKFFKVMKKQNMSILSAPAQQAKSYLTVVAIGSYEEDGEVYDREKLGLRPNDPVFMKH
jgi:hypothetical protein